MVDNFILVVGSLVEMTNILLCYTQILQSKLNIKRYRMFFLYGGLALCNILNIIFSYRIETSALNAVYCLVVPVFFIEREKKRWLLLYPCSYIMSLIVNIVVIFFMACILNIGYEEIARDNVLWLLSCMMFTIIVGLTLLWFKKNHKTNHDMLGFNGLIYIIITIGSLGFILIISAIQYFGENFQIPNNQINLLGFILSIMCVVFCLMFLWISKSVRKKEIYEKEKDMLNLYISEQEKYIKLVVEKDEDMRRFRHDIKEHMWIVSQCVEESDFDGAKEYIDKMYDNLRETEMARYTGIVALDAILSDKKRVMEEKEIKFVWNKAGDDFPQKIQIYDLCTLFINIINNAIEACELLEAENKWIEIAVEIEEQRMYIMSSNISYTEVNFDIEGNPISIKGDKKNHGLGSKNIRGVVKKYDGMIKYSVNEGMFSIEIII